MTPEQLKNSILQLAIEGKLVPQDKSEGTGAELLKTLQSASLTAPLVRGAKKALPPVTPEEEPFVIPDNWCWCRLGEIVTYSMGKTPPRAEPEWWGNDCPWVSIADMIENGHITSTKEQVSEMAIAEKFNWNVVRAGTLLMSFKLTVGRVSILDIDAVHNEAIISVYPNFDRENIFQSFLFTFLPIIANSGETKTAIKGITLNSKSIANLVIPLPPLAEQKRIVAKLEELLPLVEEYAEYYDQLQKLNQEFPGKLKKALLQFAIEGKLVPQDKSEGTGADLLKTLQSASLTAPLVRGAKKALPPVTSEEEPFVIPDNWCWCRLGEIFFLQAGKNISASSIFPKNIGGLYPCYGGNGLRGYVENYNVEGNYPLIGRQGALCGNINVASGKFYATEHAVVVYLTDSIDLSYVVYALRVLNLNQYATATAQPGLAVGKLNETVFPLPPLAEQKRIVAKLEELLPLCESLESSK